MADLATFNIPFLADAKVCRILEYGLEEPLVSWEGRVEVLGVMVTPGGFFRKGSVEFLVSDLETGRMMWLRSSELRKVRP